MKTRWVRGRPLRGFFFGLLMGFGIYLWFTKLEIAPIDTWPLLAMTGSGALLGIVRALIGRPYRTSVPPEV